MVIVKQIQNYKTLLNVHPREPSQGLLGRVVLLATDRSKKLTRARDDRITKSTCTLWASFTVWVGIPPFLIFLFIIPQATQANLRKFLFWRTLGLAGNISFKKSLVISAWNSLDNMVFFWYEVIHGIS